MFRVLLAGLYLGAGLTLGVLAWQGAPFYLTPLALRARHPGYWTFKAGGDLGHTLGIAGALMMVTLLLYSVRKRWRRLRRLGPLARWLDVHIFLGLVGPLFVVLHSSFKVQGLVALSFWSMVIVALSGVLGRYLYLQIPRSRAGEALTFQEAERLDRALAQRLRAEFGLDDEALARLAALAVPAAQPGRLRALIHLPGAGWRRTRALSAFARACAHVPRDLLWRFEEVLRQKDASHRRLLLWDRIHALFHYWHVLHKPFAVVMYAFMVLHVAVAVLTGYGWGTQ